MLNGHLTVRTVESKRGFCSSCVLVLVVGNVFGPAPVSLDVDRAGRGSRTGAQEAIVALHAFGV